MREPTTVLKDLTVNLRVLILFEGGRRELTIHLRTLILFEGGLKELILVLA